MWKNGQLVTLNGEVHQIKKCVAASGAKKCYQCGRLNGNHSSPCIAAFNYPSMSNVFDTIRCNENIPPYCVPVILNK